MEQANTYEQDSKLPLSHRFSRGIAIGALAAGSFIGFADMKAPVAQAQTTNTSCETNPSNGVETCTTTEQAIGNAVDSKTVRLNIQAQESVSTVLENTYSFPVNKQVQAERQKSCFWISGKEGVWVGGWVNGQNGKLGFRKEPAAAEVDVCRSSSSPTGYFKIGEKGKGLDWLYHIKNTDCGNPVKIIQAPPKNEIYANATIVNSLNFVAKATETATSIARTDVSVTVTSADNSCKASATAEGQSVGVARLSAYGSAAVKQEAIARAEANLNQKLVQVGTSLNDKAQTNANIAAQGFVKSFSSSHSKVYASCTETIPTPPPVITVPVTTTTVPAPPQVPPLEIIPESVQEAQPGGNRNQEIILALTGGSYGDQLDITASLQNGQDASITPAQSVITDTGGTTIEDFTFHSPSYVPSADPQDGLPQGYIRLNFTVYDQTTGQPASTGQELIQIKPNGFY